MFMGRSAEQTCIWLTARLTIFALWEKIANKIDANSHFGQIKCVRHGSYERSHVIRPLGFKTMRLRNVLRSQKQWSNHFGRSINLFSRRLQHSGRTEGPIATCWISRGTAFRSINIFKNNIWYHSGACRKSELKRGQLLSWERVKSRQRKRTICQTASKFQAQLLIKLKINV
jgi:hypothetical protein